MGITKRGRKPVNLVENKNYSEILFLVSFNSKNYNQAISKVLKKKPSTILEQLNRLEEDGFLDIKEEGGFPNKKIYSINFKRISQEFIKILKKRADEYNKDLDKANITDPLEGLDLSILEKKDLYLNQYLLNFFEDIFFKIGMVSKILPKISLKDLFEILLSERTNVLIPGKTMKAIQEGDKIRFVESETIPQTEEMKKQENEIKSLEKIREKLSTHPLLAMVSHTSKKTLEYFYEKYWK